MQKSLVTLITADHRVFNEGRESTDNHRVQTKCSYETEKSLLKFLEPSHRPKVLSTDNSMEFGKACEDLSWNHHTSTLHRSETIGIAKRAKAVRRVKEGTSAVLLQSGLDERWSVECHCYLRNLQDLLPMRRRPMKDDWENHSKDQTNRLEHLSNIILSHRKIRQEFINLAKKVFARNFSWV